MANQFRQNVLTEYKAIFKKYTICQQIGDCWLIHFMEAYGQFVIVL